jgi:hypothetical protein
MKCVRCGIRPRKPGFLNCEDCLDIEGFRQMLQPPSRWIVVLSYVLYSIHLLFKFMDRK